MKEDILSKIKSVQTVLKNTIYPLKDKLDKNENFSYYWDILEFINWAKDKHSDGFEYFNINGDLSEEYKIIDEFGHTYVKVFDVQPPPILYEDGILGISISIEDMITEFYEYVISLSDAEILAINNNTSVIQGNDTISSEKVWAMFQELREVNNKVTDVHGALFKKEKTKKDKTEVTEAGITLRLLKSKR